MLTGRRARGEHGSALLLAPVGILVLVILAAIAVDAAVLHLRQRELVAAAQSAAQDAVTFGLDEASLRGGTGVPDQQRAAQAALAAIAGADLTDLLSAPPEVVVDAAGGVSVVLHAEVATVFSGSIPGGADTVALVARAHARPVRR